jgi:putative chitinase
MKFTSSILQKILPDAPAESFAPLVSAIDRADLKTPQRLAWFIAQTAYESASYTRLTENLNYDAEGLMRVFPTHFDGSSDAKAYAHDPEKIANRVYANRLGNGDEASGDGWTFRGRGVIQMTGRTHYITCAKSLRITVPELVEGAGALPMAMDTAVVFWLANNLNALADGPSKLAITKAVNGSLASANARLALFEKALGMVS